MTWLTARAFAWLVAMVIVAALVHWDEQRSADQALEKLRRQNVAVAWSAAAAFDVAPDPEAAFTALQRVDQPGKLVILVEPDVVTARHRIRHTVETTAHAGVDSRLLETAIASGIDSTTLPPSDAANMGLPKSAAVVGIAVTRSGRAVVAVGTLRAEEERQQRAGARTALGFILAAVLGLLMHRKAR